MIFVSCENTEEQPSNSTKDNTEESNYLTEDKIVRHIEAQLNILGNEKYSYHIYEAELNSDDSLDRIVTVNLLDRAMNEAIEAHKVAKMAELGFMGNYNYFFFIDGESQVITSPIVVPSSSKAELQVSFENITSDAHKDFQIDYRIMNDCYRKFYSIDQRIPVQISETEIFQNLGKDDEKAFVVRLEPNENTIAKNIAIYKGVAEKVDVSDPDAVYGITPKITGTDELVRRWYYSPQYKKYYMKKDEI